MENPVNANRQSITAVNQSKLSLVSVIVLLLLAITSCEQRHEHLAPAVNEADSLPLLTAHGISNLISDSGIISYKIIAEDWLIYTQPVPKWSFLKGLFLEKFDTTFHVQWHVQSDTAYCHDNRTWELRGRVVVLNREGTLFETEELFWDMDAHEMWNTMYMCITKPSSNQQLRGYNFRSDEQMTDYRILNSAGYTPMNEHKDNASNSTDGMDSYQRPSTADSRRDESAYTTQH